MIHACFFAGATSATAMHGPNWEPCYQRNGNAWTQLGADIDGEAAGDRSGGAISLV